MFSDLQDRPVEDGRNEVSSNAFDLEEEASGLVEFLWLSHGRTHRVHCKDLPSVHRYASTSQISSQKGIPLITQLSTHSNTQPTTHPITHSNTQPITYSTTYSTTQQSRNSNTQPITHSTTYLNTQPITQPTLQPTTHPLIHPPIQPLSCTLLFCAHQLFAWLFINEI